MPASRPLFRTQDLGCGVRLHARRTRAFKTVHARVCFHADLDAATAARALVPRVLSRGTAARPSLRDMQIALDRLYGATLSGESRKLGERQVVQFRAEWVLDRIAGAPVLAPMAALLGEMLRDPVRDDDGGLRGEIVEQERKMLADEARSILDDKARYARHRLVEIMCRDEAFARPATGRHEEIEVVARNDVTRAHARLLDRAPIDIFVVGDLTWGEAGKFARGLGFHRGRRPGRVRRTKPRRAGRVRTVREAAPVAQAKLEMGFRSRLRLGHAGYPALVLMNALFGGTPVGALFRRVREEASLCYSIGSAVERTKGLLLVHAGIETSQYARARRLILKQLDDLRARRIDPDAREQARGILLSSLHSLRDSPHGLVEFGLERAVNGLSADLDGLLAGLGVVSDADIARAARGVELDTVFLLRGE